MRYCPHHGATAYKAKPKAGDLALCAKGSVGVITGKKGDRYIGFRLHEPKGGTWSSKKPRIIGQVEDVDAFVSILQEA